MHTNKKAQGTIEYLVIIAIVVVIALVVVTLLLQLMGQGSGVSETSSRAAWKSSVDWGVVDWSRATGGAITVVLKNNSGDTLSFTDMNLTSTAADKNITTTTGIPPGGTLTKVMNSAACAATTKYTYPKTGIVIDYNNGTITKAQWAPADILGTC